MSCRQSVDDLLGKAGNSQFDVLTPNFSSRLSEHDDETTKIQRAVAKVVDNRFMIYSHMPPTASQCSAVKDPQLPDVIYQDAFYSRESDVPERNREYAGREYRLESNTLPFLPVFDANGASPASYGIKTDSYQVQQALEQEQATTASPLHLAKLGYTQKGKSTSVEHEVQYMSTMSLEIHVNTRGKYVPNPEEDEVQCIFWWCLSQDGKETQAMPKSTGSDIIEESSELDLIVRMVEIVRTFDPDIINWIRGSW
ncbi:DNA polymerase zeta [Metarhizium acridum]|nr:DNA polymerase zeta [Metarhizium acridum]